MKLMVTKVAVFAFAVFAVFVLVSTRFQINEKRAEIEIKYAGYIKREKKEAEAFKRIEAKLLPADIDYSDIRGLKTEAAQKLSKMRPVSLGQASRISGISPADISVLVIYLSQKYPQKNFE